MSKFAVLGGLGRDQLVTENLLKHGNQVLVIAEHFNPSLVNSVNEKYSFIICQNENEVVQFLTAYAPQYIICMDETKVTDSFYSQLQEIGCFLFMPSPKTISIEQDKQMTKGFAEKVAPKFVHKSRLIFSKVRLLEELLQYDHFVLRVNRPLNSSIYFDEIPSIDFSREKVFLEKYIVGFDFTIPCFFVEGQLIYCPTLFDLPNRKVDGKIKKTSGMGVISLVKVNREMDKYINQAKFFMDRLTPLLAKKYESKNMFLSYQFRVDVEKKLIYFTEIDMKPGEPELINMLISSRKDDFGKILTKFFEGTLCQNDICIENSENIVCLTVTSKVYPNISNKLTFVGDTIAKCKSLFDDIYWCRTAIDNLGNLNGLDSRMFHLIIKGESLGELLRRCEILILTINDCQLGIIDYEKVKKLMLSISTISYFS